MSKTNPVQLDFTEELPGEIRKCLFCDNEAPEGMPRAVMTLHKGGWYSNGLIDVATGKRVTFCLCPGHTGREDQMKAWDWSRAELKKELGKSPDGVLTDG